MGKVSLATPTQQWCAINTFNVKYMANRQMECYATFSLPWYIRCLDIAEGKYANVDCTIMT